MSESVSHMQKLGRLLVRCIADERGFFAVALARVMARVGVDDGIVEAREIVGDYLEDAEAKRRLIADDDACAGGGLVDALRWALAELDSREQDAGEVKLPDADSTRASGTRSEAESEDSQSRDCGLLGSPPASLSERHLSLLNSYVDQWMSSVSSPDLRLRALAIMCGLRHLRGGVLIDQESRAVLSLLASRDFLSGSVGALLESLDARVRLARDTSTRESRSRELEASGNDVDSTRASGVRDRRAAVALVGQSVDDDSARASRARDAGFSSLAPGEAMLGAVSARGSRGGQLDALNRYVEGDARTLADSLRDLRDLEISTRESGSRGRPSSSAISVVGLVGDGDPLTEAVAAAECYALGHVPVFDHRHRRSIDEAITALDLRESRCRAVAREIRSEWLRLARLLSRVDTRRDSLGRAAQSARDGRDVARRVSDLRVDYLGREHGELLHGVAMASPDAALSRAILAGLSILKLGGSKLDLVSQRELSMSVAADDGRGDRRLGRAVAALLAVLDHVGGLEAVAETPVARVGRGDPGLGSREQGATEGAVDPAVGSPRETGSREAGMPGGHPPPPREQGAGAAGDPGPKIEPRALLVLSTDTSGGFRLTPEPPGMTEDQLAGRIPPGGQASVRATPQLAREYHHVRLVVSAESSNFRIDGARVGPQDICAHHSSGGGIPARDFSTGDSNGWIVLASPLTSAVEVEVVATNLGDAPCVFSAVLQLGDEPQEPPRVVVVRDGLDVALDGISARVVRDAGLEADRVLSARLRSRVLGFGALAIDGHRELSPREQGAGSAGLEGATVGGAVSIQADLSRESGSRSCENMRTDGGVSPPSAREIGSRDLVESPSPPARTDRGTSIALPVPGEASASASAREKRSRDQCCIVPRTGDAVEDVADRDGAPGNRPSGVGSYVLVPVCSHCERRPAECFGLYEGGDPEDAASYACGSCCAHGNEDGRCRPLTDADWRSAPTHPAG